MVARAWTKELQASSIESDEKGKSKSDKSTSRQLKAIYKDLLRFSQETSSASKTFVPKPKSDKKVIAGTLHESSEEFPCFGLRGKHSGVEGGREGEREEPPS